MLWMLTSLFDSFQTTLRPLQQKTLEGKDPTMWKFAIISDRLNQLFQNVFSDKLATLGLCMFCMMVVDLMHEIELNVWRAVFIHLLCILDYVDETLKHELDRQYALFQH
jgi:hypothetical protein